MQDFNFHQHTYRCKHSDPKMLDEEYVQEYIKMGFKKVAFTDHCPEKEIIDTRDDMRMEYSERKDYLTSIKSLKEKYKDKIEILTGYEIEYLPDQEENLKELKDETDFIVIGQHFIYNSDGKTLKVIHDSKGNFNDNDMDIYANYIENACKIGIPDIIAHPDLFMVARENFDNKAEEITKRICEISIKYNIPVEINLNNIFGKIFLNKKENCIKNLSLEEQYNAIPLVRYPNKDFWKIASRYNIKVLYGIDTHYRNQILLYADLVHLANKIIGEETINKLNFIEKM